jgi:2-dehydropantoate 2-reductase
LNDNPRIVVAGAGAIGCFVGGLLAAAGRDVTLLARRRIAREIRAHGLTLTDFNGMAARVDADALTLADSPRCLAQADIILVCVKSGDTGDIARLIESYGAPNAMVASLQNGTENAATLRDILPDWDIRAGMVPFNVVPMGQGCFHRGTSGDILIDPGVGAVEAQLSCPGLLIQTSDNMEGVQWGKFLINLNNALNALSGLTLQDQLRLRPWRKLMAAQWAEALSVLKAHKITPVSTTPVPVGSVPMILRLPTPIFTKVAAQMLTIDAQARTSMAYDLMQGRPTEINALQGQVMRKGSEVGHKTPIAEAVKEVVELAELAGEGLPNLPAKALQKEIKYFTKK